MPAYSLDDLTTPATRDDVQNSIYRVLGVLGVNTSAWGPGAVVRSMIVGVSAVLAAFSQLQAKIARSGFLDLATDDWLTLVARYVYGVERIDATFASGQVLLTNGGGGVFVMGVGDLIVLNPTTGKTYRNTAAFNLSNTPGTDTALVPVSAVEAGAASTSSANTVTDFVTPMLEVTVRNPLVLVGADAETDAAVRVRCREKLGALSPMGPWDAYAFAARNARRSGGESAGVTRTRLTKDGYGNVTLYIANLTGEVLGTIGDRTTDLGAVDYAIQRQAAPLGVTAHVESADAVAQNFTYELWAYNTSGLNDQQIKDLASAALTSFITVQPVGGNVLTPVDATGKVYTDRIRAAIVAGLALGGVEVFHIELTSPAADIELDAFEVVTVGTVTATVHQVAPPEGAAAS
jgi:phage-related baseplate assembly protein